MRVLGVALALLVATGCTANQVGVEHTANLETRTRGVALQDDVDSAQVGMSANTCQVQTTSGAIGADVDVAPAEDDQVTDAVGLDTVVIGSAGAYVLDNSGWASGGPVVDRPGITDAKLTSAGDIVAVQDNGTISWNGAEDVTTNGMTDFAIDRATGMAFVVDGRGLTVATPGATESSVDGDFDFVAYDPASDAIYVAALNGTEVRALELNGSQRWAADLGQPITALDDMGLAGAVMVMTGDENSGNLFVLDGRSGEQLSDISIPETGDELMMGNNGDSMAVVVGNEVHFFAVNVME